MSSENNRACSRERLEVQEDLSLGKETLEDKKTWIWETRKRLKKERTMRMTPSRLRRSDSKLSVHIVINI